MNVLYVGHYGEGSTSRMRGEYLQKLLGAGDFLVVDIDIPISKTPQPFLSLGWRYKKGPLIVNINRYLSEKIEGNSGFDLVWIDKGVFIEPSFLNRLLPTARSYFIKPFLFMISALPPNHSKRVTMREAEYVSY